MSLQLPTILSPPTQCIPVLTLTVSAAEGDCVAERPGGEQPEAKNAVPTASEATVVSQLLSSSVCCPVPGRGVAIKVHIVAPIT